MAAAFSSESSIHMPNITFIEPDGTTRDIAFTPGETVMQAATGAGIAGIIGECGGSCMCATCHVYLDEADFARLPAAESLELETLEFVATNPRTTSRLGCQIRLDDALDGLVLHVAGL
jgi:2Fe-2S ferredoxin